MCLAVPAQIKSIRPDGSALCDLNGIEKPVDISLIASPAVGDWVIVHVGFALNKIDASEAKKTLELLRSVAQKDETCNS